MPSFIQSSHSCVVSKRNEEAEHALRRLNDGGSSFARMPTEAHPTSKLAGTPISDDETVAKMGHPDVGHPSPPEVMICQM
jgi:hypothetical protein